MKRQADNLHTPMNDPAACCRVIHIFLTNNIATTDGLAGCASNKETIKKRRHALLGACEPGGLVALMMSNGRRCLAEFNQSLCPYLKEKYGVHVSPFEHVGGFKASGDEAQRIEINGRGWKGALENA